MKTIRLAGLLGAVLVWGAVPALAQPVIGAKSGVVNVAEGKVYLGDQLLELQPTQFPDIKENTILRTEEGRAEVLLTPGVFLRVWENSSFKMISNRLIDTRIELLSGSAVIEADDIAKDTALTVVCKDGTITLSKVGLYRFDMDPAQLKVFAKGPAEVALGGQTYSVSSGKMITLGGAVAAVEKFNPEMTDSLDHWSRRRGEVLANANVSAANRASTGYGSMNPCGSIYNTGRTFPQHFGNWGYNPYYGLITYIPCGANIYSPYGYRLWSPNGIYRAFYAPRPTYTGGGYGGYNSMPTYPTMGATSGGYSGAMSSGSVGSSAPAAVSSGSSAAASAGSSSVGHGSGGGGGRGH